MKYLFKYDGPVMSFDTIIARRWKGETYAESVKKARNNLAYQFKKTHGFAPTTRITCPGKLIEDTTQKSM